MTAVDEAPKSPAEGQQIPQAVRSIQAGLSIQPIQEQPWHLISLRSWLVALGSALCLSITSGDMASCRL